MEAGLASVSAGAVSGGCSIAAGASSRREALLSQVRLALTPADVVRAVHATLDAPGVFVFGEFLSLPSVQQLAGTEYEKHLKLLKLFAYGTLRDYKGNEVLFPQLSETQLRKLRQLSVASLAARSRSLPYADMMYELGLQSRRELEDLVIEAIYAAVVRGKLDQRRSCFQVDSALARDVPDNMLASISRLLDDWCVACEDALFAAEGAASRADGARSRHRQRQAAVEERAGEIRQGQQQQQQQQQLQPMDTQSEAAEAHASGGNSSSSSSSCSGGAVSANVGDCIGDKQ